jgi:hypothetical protein
MYTNEICYNFIQINILWLELVLFSGLKSQEIRCLVRESDHGALMDHASKAETPLLERPHELARRA